jgi:Uma2 family endonuclease
MQTAIRERKTYADYAALEEGVPYQLIDGEFVMSPSPTFYHQKLTHKLSSALGRFVEERGLGEVVSAPMDVYLTDIDAYQPDVLFISNERLHIVKERVHGAPDLVMEVLSPSTGFYDLTQKKRIYAISGVQEYWVVDPVHHTVEVLINTGGDYETFSSAYQHGQVQSRQMDGFTVDIEKLFSI